jgi:SAM-dependent methyltransferase
MGDSSQPKFSKNSLVEVGFFSSSAKRLALNTGSVSKNFGADYSFLGEHGVTLEGCDIEAGVNVDHVFDLTHEPPVELAGKYDLIISSSTLEHVTAPWKAATCLENLLKSQGFLYISVPWIWRYHAYPNDYWRFNRHTLDFLFEGSDVKCQAWSTSPDCNLYPCSDSFDDANSKLLDSSSNHSLIRRIRSRFQPRSVLNTKKKYLPYLMIHQLRQRQ